MRVFDIFRFAWNIIIYLVNPSSHNPAMRCVIVKQIYFTAVEIIPLFMVIAVVFGSVVIDVVIAFAATYDLQEHIGSIILTFVMNEFAPFFTALLIALRSGAAINIEIAVMQVNNEMNALRAYGIDIVNYLFLPRIIRGMMSITLLSLMFAIISTDFLVASLIKERLIFTQKEEMVQLASQYGYKKAVIFWLQESLKNSTSTQKKNCETKNRAVAIVN